MTGATIGIIGASGWMGAAIAHSLLRTGFIDARSLILSGRSTPVITPLAQWPDVAWTSNNQELAERSEVVVLSVRPQQFPDIQISASEKLIISIMAGVSVSTISTQTGASRIVRAMPNAAARIGRSYTPWVATQGVMGADKAFVQAFFETFGAADELSREADVDYMSGLTGSGPAFPALLADAMVIHAQARGLPTDIVHRAVGSIVAGASQLLIESNASPADVVRQYLAYGGTTAAALQAMLDLGFMAVVHAGLEAADSAAVRMAGLGPRLNR
jgi:pyrroline-5-carboxylate reductase